MNNLNGDLNVRHVEGNIEDVSLTGGISAGIMSADIETPTFESQNVDPRVHSELLLASVGAVVQGVTDVLVDGVSVVANDIAYITLSNKVDKIAGKGLSTNDFTNEDKALVNTIAGKASQSSLTAHVNNTQNPHAVSKAQVGLGNVDNTADLDKPISTATQTALNTKQQTLSAGVNIKTINGASVLGAGNLTIDKSGVGLGNVDNTSDANKPISTAMQTALDGKQDTLVSGSNIKKLNNQSVLGSGNLAIDKSFVGLSNVDNTADLDKPISSATQNALNAKQQTLVSGSNIKTINGTSVLGSGDIAINKSTIGLGNVDNTADLDKPISTATQTALNTKQDTLVNGSNIKSINNQNILGSGSLTIDKAFVDLGNVDNTSDLSKPISSATQTALNGKQATLVSGTNIKTINGQSVLGSGNIDIQGGQTDLYSLASGATDNIVVLSKNGTAQDSVTINNVSHASNADSALSAGSAGSAPWSGISGKPTFAPVATSGAYSDLSNKPTIHTYTLSAGGTANIIILNADGSPQDTLTINNVANADSVPWTGITNNPLNDYIVEQGYSNHYRYIKYNSGWADLYYYNSMSGVAMVAYNNEYRVPLDNMTDHTFPFTLYTTTQGAPMNPAILGSCAFDGIAVGPYFSSNDINGTQWHGNILSPKNHGTQNWRLCLHIGGYWKVS